MKFGATRASLLLGQGSADESATQAGLSEPSTSTVKRVTIWNQPPPTSSTSTTSAVARIREPDGHRRREADLVPAVVDAQLEAASSCSSSIRRPSIRDRVRLPWATVVPNGLSLLGPLDVGVDPLVVAGRDPRRCRCPPA